MKMVRWMCNVNVKDRVTSKELRERLGTDDARMGANAQRDDHPAEYRWRPLFNDAKFG